eukprot:6813911-Heterocapsa_arctica.AAC.1
MPVDRSLPRGPECECTLLGSAVGFNLISGCRAANYIRARACAPGSVPTPGRNCGPRTASLRPRGGSALSGCPRPRD